MPDIYVDCSTSPPAARVYVDGVDTGKSTPCTLRFPLSDVGKTKEIKFWKPGYKICKKKITLAPGITVSCKLTQKTGTVYVNSEPDGARIKINGELQTKKTDAKFVLPLGTYRIEAYMEPEECWEGKMDTTISIEQDGDIKVLSTQFKKTGTLSIYCNNDFECDIYIDDEKIGTTPIEKKKMEEGIYTIRAVPKVGHPEIWKQINPVNNTASVLFCQGTIINFEFEKRRGTVKIASIPPGCMIYIDGAKGSGLTTIDGVRIAMDAGAHEVRVVPDPNNIFLKMLGEETMSIWCDPDEELTHTFKLDIDYRKVADMTIPEWVKVFPGPWNRWYKEPIDIDWRRLGQSLAFSFGLEDLWIAISAVGEDDKVTDEQLEAMLAPIVGVGGTYSLRTTLYWDAQRAKKILAGIKPRIGGWLRVCGILASWYGAWSLFLFLQEEALQTTSMGVWVQVSGKQWESAEATLETYKDLLDLYEKLLKVSWVAPPLPIFYEPYLKAGKMQYSAYKKAIADHKDDIYKPPGAGVETGPVYISSEPSEAEIYWWQDGEWKPTYMTTPQWLALPKGKQKIRLHVIDWQGVEWEKVEEINVLSPTEVKSDDDYKHFITLEKVKPPIPEEFKVWVTRIVDGDTVATSLNAVDLKTNESVSLPEYITPAGKKTGECHIRLAGINSCESDGTITCECCPDLKKVDTKWYRAAKDNLLPINKEYVIVKVDPENQMDKNGRILGVVFKDNVNYNLKQITDGMACVQTYGQTNKYVDKEVYTEAETEARNKKIGIWSLPTGKLHITSSPTGAKIYIDGKDTGKTTAETIEVTVGTHTVKVTKTGYKTQSKSVTVKEDETTDVNFTLVPTTGSIHCITTPTYCKILLDGKDTGKVTTDTIKDVSEGIHTITFKKDGYKDCTKTVNVIAGETIEAFCELQEIPPTTGSIHCTGKPTGAEIWIDNSFTGKYVSETLTDISVGSHTITYKKEGYQDKSKTVNVIAGETTEVYMELQEIPPTTGSIHVTSTPTYAKILLDGKDTGKLTASTISNVNEGEHSVTVTKEGYESATQNVNVIAGETIEIHFDLVEIPVPPTEARYYIKAAYDKDGNELSSVKIYVDGQYIHHYVPQELIFGPGKTIDTYVSGELGEHTIRLEKNELSWQETITLKAGDDITREPVLTTPAPETVCDWINKVGINNLTLDHALYVFYKSKKWDSLANQKFNKIPEASRKEIPASSATLDNALGTYYYSKGWKNLGDKKTGCKYGG